MLRSFRCPTCNKITLADDSPIPDAICNMCCFCQKPYGYIYLDCCDNYVCQKCSYYFYPHNDILAEESWAKFQSLLIFGLKEGKVYCKIPIEGKNHYWLVRRDYKFQVVESELFADDPELYDHENTLSIYRFTKDYTLIHP